MPEKRRPIHHTRHVLQLWSAAFRSHKTKIHPRLRLVLISLRSVSTSVSHFLRLTGRRINLLLQNESKFALTKIACRVYHYVLLLLSAAADGEKMQISARLLRDGFLSLCFETCKIEAEEEKKRERSFCSFCFDFRLFLFLWNHICWKCWCDTTSFMFDGNEEIHSSTATDFRADWICCNTLHIRYSWCNLIVHLSKSLHAKDGNCYNFIDIRAVTD